MTISDDAPSTWVLRVEAVRWGIGQLSRKRAHPFFLAYLHLRTCAISAGDNSNVRPRWNELGEYLYVPGGPPRKPYYRPLFDPPGNPSRYWLNENLAGSFAISSLREGMPPMQVVGRGTTRGTFSLRSNHADHALHHLLFDEPLAVYPFASFLYRDFGFVTDGPKPEPRALIEIFRENWGLASNTDVDDDFGTLFYDDASEFTENFFERSSYSEEAI